MTACATCGQEVRLDGRVSVDLDSNIFVADGQAVHLQAHQAEIMHALVAAMPGVVRHQVLVNAVYGLEVDSPEDPLAVIKVHICRTRDLIVKTPYRILNVHGVGYRLVRHESA